ncbi:MAG: TIGR02391 family protein [Minisyncoccia bacterium]
MFITKATKTLITKFKTKYVSDLERLPIISEKLQGACGKIERTWSGSFAGWHGKMYFHDFKSPSINERFSSEWGDINGIPAGWEEKQPEEVLLKINRLVGTDFSIDNLKTKIAILRTDIQELKNEIIIAFSSFTFDKNTVKEKSLYAQIESYEFGVTKDEFILNRLPKTMMSRDTEALSQGTCIPSWLYCEGIAIEAKSLCEATNKFLILIDRLLRQLEMKQEGGTTIPFPLSKKLSSLNLEIYSKTNSLYIKGEYAEAVEKSFKVVRDRLRQLTGYETGSEAFGKGKLHIRGAAAPNVDNDFNAAVKFLTMAIDCFRNEKSHTSDAKIDDPIRAYEYLSLSSLAMHLLENIEIL